MANESKLFINTELEARKQREIDFIDKLYIISELPPSFLWEECEVLMTALMEDKGVTINPREIDCHDPISGDPTYKEEYFFDRINALDCQSITKFARICNNHLNFENLK